MLIIKLTNTIIIEAIKQGATHVAVNYLPEGEQSKDICTDSDSFFVWFKKNGEWGKYISVPKKHEGQNTLRGIIARIAMMACIDEDPGHGTIKLNYNDRQYDIPAIVEKNIRPGITKNMAVLKIPQTSQPITPSQE